MDFFETLTLRYSLPPPPLICNRPNNYQIHRETVCVEMEGSSGFTQKYLYNCSNILVGQQQLTTTATHDLEG